MTTTLERLQERVRAAAASKSPLAIRGSGSKACYGAATAGAVLDAREHAGIAAYEPTELYVTAHCGTRLADLECTLAEAGQMLGFEPPHFGGGTTVGGMVAAGLSGPRRVQHGPLRDHVLGVAIVDGNGDALRFGGRVIKNVAGYDVSRLLAGSRGTLALITAVTLKVLPRPRCETTLCFELPPDRAQTQLTAWFGQALPISASTWRAGRLWLRLSGADAGVCAARAKLGGAAAGEAEAAAFWQCLRDAPPVLRPPPPALLGLYQRVKQVFDPHGIFPSL